MKHQASPRFWRHYRELPESVRRLADKNFVLLKADPFHPSLHLKRIDRVWSVRVGAHYRALGLDASDSIVWFWIGSHADYEALMIPTAEQIVERERRGRVSHQSWCGEGCVESRARVNSTVGLLRWHIANCFAKLGLKG